MQEFKQLLKAQDRQPPLCRRPNDVPAQTPTPPIINGTGTQMPEGGFPIPDIFARRNPLSLPGSSGFEAQAFSSSIKPAGYREGGDVKGMNRKNR